MAVSRIVQQTTTSTFSNVHTAPAAATNYIFEIVFPVGRYKIDCLTSVITTATFITGPDKSNQVVSTSSGTVSFNLNNEAVSVILRTDTGSNNVITITRVGDVSQEKTTVLETLTSTQTYTQTGKAIVAVIGGGGGGNSNTTGGGGGSGYLNKQIINLPGSIPLVVGSGGNANVPGGTTTFGNITALGGSSGIGTSGGPGGSAGGGGNLGPAAGSGAIEGGSTPTATGSGLSLGSLFGASQVASLGGPAPNWAGWGGIGGGIYGGGGGGNNGNAGYPAGGGGGGGVVPGNTGSGYPSRVAGTGGAGGVIVLRWTT
jgi:hypothetical protein